MEYKDIAKKTIGHLYLAHTSIRSSGIDTKLIALVELYVSQVNGCAYCCAFHAQELREMGITQELIDKIPGYKHSSAFTPQQSIVLEWAEAVITLSERIDTLKTQLRDYFNDREIVELTASISLMGALNRLRITLADKT
ncbi:carboxymuconolactone decarboxylase family protein [Acinetobacter puyangensis]|uniref:Alkylhydroperoxidase AhpD family core domain-containing protein n=1 Tax=Acinetobacter puyangensis TaxID=1096779 RepID=A0A240E691_9GAMM|nr:carboxymuconolactone decarboxylase family protein [Acinetobacter puyangensis]SNX43390.1 alkylhydroperoxidase AhpD family core domain-containing protein [Acinetobacter puyangensis]